MKPFTFASLLLLQRADDALKLETSRTLPRMDILTELRRRKSRLIERLRRSPYPAVAAGS